MKYGNPKADLSCGVENPGGHIPIPIHYDCHECRRAVTDILRLRIPAREPEKEPEPLPLFDDLSPVKRRKSAKSNS